MVVEVVGRDDELEILARWLGSPRPALLEIEGEAGIGKTTLWEEGIRAAGAAGALVLACRPVEVETAVSYGALASLLEPALALVGDEVPPPRLLALEGALRLREVSGSNLDETAVALGALSLMRAAAERQPLVLALEDVQWLDMSSRIALTYALRNLRAGDDVAVLVTRRTAPDAGALELGGSVLAGQRERLAPGPLSLGALHRMIRDRLGTTLSRPKVVYVHSASRGNPFYALELARVAAQSVRGEVAHEVPASLADLLRARIATISTSARSLLLAVAAAGDPRRELLERLTAPTALAPALDEAVRQGVLVVTEGRVRFSHPLLASTVYADAGALERNRVHVRLAELSETSEERARHLALAGSGPDEKVASALVRAAESACRLGARGTGAELYEQAASLTPPGDTSTRDTRLVAAAHAHFQSGEPDVARELLEAVAELESPVRFAALCRLGILLDETVGGEASFDAFEQALGTDDPVIAAQAHCGLAQALTYVGNIDLALEHADAAVVAAEPLADRALLVYALSMQALVRKIAGHSAWRESLGRALALESEVELPELDGCPSAFEADIRRLLFDLDEARIAYDRMLGRAGERGDVPTEAWCRFGLASIEIASGRWDRAAEHGDELSNLADQTAFFRLPALRTTAHLAILAGDVGRARVLLDAAVAEAEPKGELHNLRTALQLQGFLELSLGDPGSAIPPLRRARLIAERMAIREPGLLTFLLDEVEALAGTDDPEAAAVVLRAFQERTLTSESEWIAPLVLRADGLVRAAERDLDGARASLEAAVAAEDAVPLPLERARTRLAYGRILRRAQQRSAAHATLGEALALFEELGAPLWAERARDELGRIGGRTPTRGELTAAERHVAELVAHGKANKEIAAELFVSVKTVEFHLGNVYRKLGVHSRVELARRLPSTPAA